jgi:kynurenine formamidase
VNGQPTEAEVRALIETASNAGRWGPDDELGTLNLITPERRVAAAALVRTGRVVSLALPLTNHPPKGSPHAFIHRMVFSRQTDAISAQDVVEFAPHGFQVTHFDALGHMNFSGEIYNRHPAAEVVTAEGIAFGSVMAPARLGIFTRGILLDVAAALNRNYLDAGEYIEPDHLEAAEAAVGLRAGPGDAVLVRVGLGAREAAEGPEDLALRAGLSPACITWFRDRDIAVYGGDCIERIPSGYASISHPFHFAALARLGLAVIDNLDMEALAAAAQQSGRHEFLLTCAPLPIEGGTASPINPLAVF